MNNSTFLIDKISKAQSNISIKVNYFTHKRIYNCLIEKAKKGVEIKIMLISPSSNLNIYSHELNQLEFNFFETYRYGKKMNDFNFVKVDNNPPIIGNFEFTYDIDSENSYLNIPIFLYDSTMFNVKDGILKDIDLFLAYKLNTEYSFKKLSKQSSEFNTALENDLYNQCKDEIEELNIENAKRIINYFDLNNKAKSFEALMKKLDKKLDLMKIIVKNKIDLNVRLFQNNGFKIKQRVIIIFFIDNHMSHNHGVLTRQNTTCYFVNRDGYKGEIGIAKTNSLHLLINE